MASAKNASGVKREGVQFFAEHGIVIRRIKDIVIDMKSGEPMKELIEKQAAIDAVCMEWCNVKHQNCKHPFDDEKDDYYWCNGCETALRTLPDLPSAQPERTEYIPDTKAVRSKRDCVDLSERVSATFYDQEHEEWTQQTVTIADVLDSVCDEYTILPSAQPEIIRCKDCKHVRKWRDEESAKKFGQVYECARGVFACPKPEDFCSHAERIEEK